MMDGHHFAYLDWTRRMNHVEARPYADPEIAARKLVELAASIEPVQDGRIHIEKINARFSTPSTPLGASSAQASSMRSSAAGSICTRAGPMSVS
ncbi:hypothetical protein SAMN05216338_103856 [Bradyrhizobium sp. Rc2d]|nr:hypothetical protein SAMN05216338_103856 [Bradyrhizobium sp. Rc2d]